MLTQAQKEQRKCGIGGSDMPIILGLSSYKTPYQLWLEKTGQLDDTFEETPYQHWGNKLESVIREEFAEKHNVIITTPDTITHPFYEFLLANVDGYIVETNEIFEAKASSQFMAEQWGESGSDIIPMAYLVQIAHYCIVTNADRAHLAVLIGGNDYREYIYERDNELEQTLIKAAKEFWECVKNNTAPASINTLDLKLQFPRHDPNKTVEVNQHIMSEIKKLHEVKIKIKELVDVETKHKFEVMNYMQDAEALINEEKILATFKSNKNGARSFLLK